MSRFFIEPFPQKEQQVFRVIELLEYDPESEPKLSLVMLDLSKLTACL
jgi:hypothetical protein